jgi:hypothetical protein
LEGRGVNETEADKNRKGSPRKGVWQRNDLARAHDKQGSNPRGGIVTYYQRDEAVKLNLRKLRKLDPVQVLREWCAIDRKAFEGHWKPGEPEDWFWKKKGLITEYAVPAGDDVITMYPAMRETFESEEGWQFHAKMQIELDKVADELETEEKGKEREEFEKALNGLLERATAEKWVRATQHDVRLFLFENQVDLPHGNLGMLTLALNRKLGAKEQKREVVPPELREEILRRANGRCENCGEPTKFLQIDHRTPVSRGGTNDPSNLHALCPSCNSKKGNR